MSSDAGQREPVPQRPELDIPNLVRVDISRVPFEPPRLRHFRSALAEHSEAIEVRVATDRPLPLDRAVPPVLFVGDVRLTEMRVIAEREYAFLAFDEERLEPGAPITLALPDAPAEERARQAPVYRPPSA